MALKLAEEQAQREEDERKEDEATNPMKVSDRVVMLSWSVGFGSTAGILAYTYGVSIISTDVT